MAVLGSYSHTIPCFSYGLRHSPDIEIPFFMKDVLNINYTPIYLEGQFEECFDDIAESAIFHSDGLGDLEKANAQLAAFATQAEELAMTQERNRLAREIHDNLGHTLTIVNVQIEAAKTVMDTDPDRAMDALNKAQELAQTGLAGVRKSVAALRESPVSNRPLSEAIASLVEEEQSGGIVTEFKVTGEPHPLEHKVALALYRVAQEGLTNVRRHARASRVDVLLDFQPDEVHLEVKDNGMGTAEIAGGFGFLGIRERMQLLGGKVTINTGVGKGFCLTARPSTSAELDHAH